VTHGEHGKWCYPTLSGLKHSAPSNCACLGAAQAICRAFSQVRCGIERLPCARPIGHGREVALANVLDLPAESVIAASFAGGGEQTHPGRTASPTRVWTTESPPFGISRDS